MYKDTQVFKIIIENKFFCWLAIFKTAITMSPIDTAKLENDRRILELLSQTFPNVSAASTEIINLEAILNLPKGTEHFVADLHGDRKSVV